MLKTLSRLDEIVLTTCLKHSVSLHNHDKQMRKHIESYANHIKIVPYESILNHTDFIKII